MLAQVGSGAHELDGARAAGEEMIESFVGTPASVGDEFRGACRLLVRSGTMDKTRASYLATSRSGAPAGAFITLLVTNLKQVVLGDSDVLHGHEPRTICPEQL